MIQIGKNFRIDNSGHLWRLVRGEWERVETPKMSDPGEPIPGLRWESVSRGCIDGGDYIFTFRIKSTGELIRWIGRDGVGTWDLWRSGGRIEDAYTAKF